MPTGSEPLDILCEEALKLDARVRFRDPEVDGVVNLEDTPLEEDNEENIEFRDNVELFELEGLSEDGSRAAECIADLLYERHLDARLEQALFNKHRNTKRYAYGELSVLDNKRRNVVPREPRQAPSQPEEPRSVCENDSRGRLCGPHGADAQGPAHADAAAGLDR
jgi:hypothetical protein